MALTLERLFVCLLLKTGEASPECITASQTIEETALCVRDEDARRLGSPTYGVLTLCLCHHTEAAEETFDSTGWGSGGGAGAAKNIMMTSARFFRSVLDNNGEIKQPVERRALSCVRSDPR